MFGSLVLVFRRRGCGRGDSERGAMMANRKSGTHSGSFLAEACRMQVESIDSIRTDMSGFLDR